MATPGHRPSTLHAFPGAGTRLRPRAALDHSWMMDRMLPAGSRNQATGAYLRRAMDALRVRPGAGRVVFEPNSTGRELIDRSLNVLDQEVQDRERRRRVVGLRVDHDPRPRSEVDLQTGRHVGVVHTQRYIGHLKPKGGAVELLGPWHVVHGEARKGLCVLQHLACSLVCWKSRAGNAYGIIPGPGRPCLVWIRRQQERRSLVGVVPMMARPRLRPCRPWPRSRLRRPWRRAGRGRRPPPPAG
jgi:hypothetical protein